MFLEQIQRSNLAKNVMITGTPNNEVIIDNVPYLDHVIFDGDEDELKTAEMIFKNIKTKSRLMKEAKK